MLDESGPVLNVALCVLCWRAASLLRRQKENRVAKRLGATNTFAVVVDEYLDWMVDEERAKVTVAKAR